MTSDEKQAATAAAAQMVCQSLQSAHQSNAPSTGEEAGEWIAQAFRRAYAQIKSSLTS